jgi:hypothetical protein
VPVDRNSGVADRRRPAGDLIAAVLDNMRSHLERLKYSTLAPSRYLVYIHPLEYARLEGIIPILQEETVRALADEVNRLNRRSGLRRYTERVFGEPAPPVQSASGDWHVEFRADPDGVVNEDDILVDSELMLPAAPELGVGESTRRITTLRSGQRTTTRETTVNAGHDLAPARAFASIVYEDSSGHHSYDIVKDSITIGRGGITYPVDVKILSSVDVSREHARIRRDGESGRFFLIDLSSLGTTLNGRHVPRGYVEANGTKKENGVETPLPDQARIGLAETVFLNFTVVSR